MKRFVTALAVIVLALSMGTTSEAKYVDYYKNIQPVNRFVERMYTVVLDRECDVDGYNNWRSQLIEKKIDGAGISRGFILSSEFKNRNLSDSDYLDVLYKTFFNREADEAGKNNWMTRLSEGYSREYVLAGFVNSREFDELTKSYGIIRGTLSEEGEAEGTGLEGYVERLYKKALGRGFDPEGKKNWVNTIKSGQKSAMDVAKSFFFSKEFVNKNLSNADYVETLYKTFMGRSSDAAGKANWVELLETGKKNREQVLEGFANSKEFANILKSFGISSCPVNGTHNYVLKQETANYNIPVMICAYCGATEGCAHENAVWKKGDNENIMFLICPTCGALDTNCIHPLESMGYNDEANKYSMMVDGTYDAICNYCKNYLGMKKTEVGSSLYNDFYKKPLPEHNCMDYATPFVRRNRPYWDHITGDTYEIDYIAYFYCTLCEEYGIFGQPIEELGGFDYEQYEDADDTREIWLSKMLHKWDYHKYLEEHPSN